jgi:Asp-tRNA(Asn)/Glu-tRNA(Gln) amidotransferase C subunit
MFAKTIIDSDAFLDMPMSARLLYYDLSMRADDDGFVNSPKKIMRMVGATQDDLGILAMRKFIIPFESGVVVIKHWKIHNYIRKDTYNETKYKEEKAMLAFDENNAYTQRDDLSTPRLRHVDDPSTQVRLGKDRLGKDSLEEDILPDSNESLPPPKPKKPVKHKHGQYKRVLLTDDELEKLKTEFPDWEERIERLDSYIEQSGKTYKSHLATIRNWARRDKDEPAKRPRYIRKETMPTCMTKDGAWEYVDP